MKYNLKQEIKQSAIKKRIDHLIKIGATVILKEVKSKRSINENALYWLWLTCMESETGQPKEDLHEYFKYKFLGTEKVNVLDEIIVRPKSSKVLDITEFAKYMNKIKDFALIDLGIELLSPEQKHFDEFYKEYAI